MKRLLLLSGIVLALAGSALAAEPTSAALMAQAENQAQREHKNVFVIFHASWCGWCHRLDGFLADPQMSKLMTDSFVVVHIDVMENPDKKTLENDGGADLMKQWNGEKAGLPFMVVLDSKGKKVSDSNLDASKPSNIGYPAKPEEVAHFMKMLNSAPQLTKGQKKEIQGWLTTHAPKQ